MALKMALLKSFPQVSSLPGAGRSGTLRHRWLAREAPKRLIACLAGGVSNLACSYPMGEAEASRFDIVCCACSGKSRGIHGRMLADSG